MAVRATYSKFLIDEFDFSCDTNSMSISSTVNALDSTTLCATGTTFVPGLPTGMITHGGYFSGPGAGEIEQELHARLGTATAVYVAAVVGTTAIDCPVFIAESSWGEQLTIEMAIDNLITLSGQWPASNGLVRGIRIADATLSATGAGTAYDLGAAGTSGKAYLFVTGISGTATNATIDVESSTTQGGAYASEGTFTLSAVGVYTAALSGTINQWVRINTTSLGGATSITAICVVALDGVTQ